MNCAEARDRFLDIHYGLLEADEIAAVYAHLQACPACAAERQALLDQWSSVESWQPEAPRRGLAERAIAGAIQAPHPWLRGFRRFAGFVAAACVFAAVSLGGAGAWVNARSPSPQEIILIGDAEILTGGPAALRVVVRDHATSRPLAGIELFAELIAAEGAAPVRIGAVTSDAHGSADVRFDVPDLPAGDYRLRLHGSGDPVELPVRLRRAFACLLTSDKPLYQPGQTLHARVIASRLPQRKPVADAQALFTVTDPKGNVIYKQIATTSRFGIAAIDMEFADELNLGTYRLAVKIGDTQSERTVEVKRYVLPKYRVTVQPDRGFYLPGAAARVRVDAQYTFGKPVAGGAVEVEVVSADSVKGQEFWNALWANPHEGRPTVEAPKPLASARGTIGADGSLDLELALPQVLAGTPLNQGDAELLLTATVTDGAGHAERGFANLTVSEKGLRLLLIPCQANAVPEVDNEYFVLAVHPDGTPAEAEVELNFLPQGIAGARGRTGENGVARLHAAPPAGARSAFIRAKDARGASATGECPLAASTEGAPFLFWTDRAVYQAGETLHAYARSGLSEEILFVDVIRDRQTVLTRLLELHGGKAELALDLGADLAGTIELHAYRLLASGEFAREVRFVHVRAEGDLKIDLTLDKQTYRPGEEASLAFRVTDRQGAPVPAAIGLSAVDEALFALADAEPGLARVNGAIEDRLLQPLYQIKYPWSPAALRGDGGDMAAVGLAAAAWSRSGPSEEEAADLDELRRSSDRLSRFPGSNSILTSPDVRAKFALLGVLESGRKKISSFVCRERALEIEKRSFQAWSDSLWKGVLVLFIGVVCLWLISEAFVAMRAAAGGCTFLATLIWILAALFLPTLASVRHRAQEDATTALLRRLETSIHLYVSRYAGSASVAWYENTPPTRIRRDFPELLYWNPEIVTDDHGEARVTIPLADSITTWRLTQDAVSADGRFGAANGSLRVFQDFFVDLDLPLSLTQGDEVTIPVAAYNYLKTSQTIQLRLEAGDAIELLDGGERTLELAADRVSSASFRVRARAFGVASLTVHAKGSAGLTDAVQRSVAVLPNGTERTTGTSGRLTRAEDISIDLPANAIPGTEDLFLRVYPSRFSEVMHGLESIVQLPYG